MKKENITRFSGIRYAVIPVFTILLLSLSGRETTIIQDDTQKQYGSSSTEKIQSVAMVENSADKLESIKEMRIYIAKNIKYPKDAAESGQRGIIELFARIGGDGRITEVMELQPEEGFIDIDEIVIVAYKAENVEATESSKHEILISEGRRVINTFPKLEIPELYGKIMKLKFKFVLQ